MTYTGDDNPNVYAGGSDADTLTGNGGDDILSGGGGGDTIQGGDGNDILFSADRYVLFRYPYSIYYLNSPVLDTGAEADTVSGGANDDYIFAGFNDTVDGGSGNDYLYLSLLGASSGVTLDFRLASIANGAGTISGIENVGWIQGSNFDDEFILNGTSPYSPSPVVYAMGGNDRVTADYYTRQIFGDDGNDVIDGRPSQYLDRIDGGNGDDTLYTNTNTFASAYGGAGNDTIYAHGNVYGGAGNDLILLQASYYGGTVNGEAGDDDIRAAAGFGYFMAGGSGADVITGNTGDDTLSSGELETNSTIPADDTGLERDRLFGGGGSDTLAIGYGDDADGGSGSDSLRISMLGAGAGITINTSGFKLGSTWSLFGGTIQNIETLSRLTGSNFADTINVATHSFGLTVYGGDGDDVVTASASTVTFIGGAGNDRFISGTAADVFNGAGGIDIADYSKYGSAVTVTFGASQGAAGSGPGGDQLSFVEEVWGSSFGDTINGSNDADALWGFAGDDMLRGNGGNDSLHGGSGNDTLAGGDGSDFLNGGDGNDMINGDAGDDTLIGIAGTDILSGGTGNDTYVVRSNTQVIEGTGGGNRDAVFTTGNYALAGNQHVEVLAANDAASTVGLTLTGNALAQDIAGTAGADVLNGGGGADLLIGRGGDDIYYITDAAARVYEEAGGGRDAVYTSVNYELTGGHHVEVLAANNAASTVGLTLIGNERGQDIAGTAGADLLIGRGGADLLVGRGGNDVYIVIDAAERVYEEAGGGRDTVYTTVSYQLTGGHQIEVLAANDPSSTIGLTLIGNEHAQDIAGTAGADLLISGGGADLLVGRGGNDAYIVTDAATRVYEEAGGGQDVVYARVSYTLTTGHHIEALAADNAASTVGLTLTGNEFAQDIAGTAGADTLNGLGGADFLIGRGGADTFAFTTALGGGNVDRLHDMVSGVDRIALDDAVFTGLGLGTLNPNAFRVGTTAQDADDRIIYDQATGTLLFDADGAGGAAAIQFATVNAGQALAASDFFVI